MSTDYLISPNNPEYSSEIFITKKEVKELVSLLTKADSNKDLSSKEKTRLIELDEKRLKEEVIYILLSSDDPWEAKRDEVRSALNEMGISFTRVITTLNCKNYTELKEGLLTEAGIKKKQEEKNSEYIDRDYFNKNPKVKDDSHLTYKRGYFVTAVVGDMGLNLPAFETVLNYCKIKGYELILLPMKNAYRNRTDREDRTLSDYPKALHPYMESSFYTEYIFNENVRAKDFLLLPQQKNPLTGLLSYGKKQYSLIVANPKQDMQTIPVASGKHPHIIHSTGTLSLPTGYFNDRVGKIATEDHINGGLIIEIDDEKTFFLRQIQFDDKGGFNDIDTYFYGKKTKKAKSIAVTLGDLHNKLESDEAWQASCEWIDLLKPQEIYLQDSVDMHSVNPHHLKSIYDRVHKYPEIDTLEKELNAFGEKLLEINKRFPYAKVIDVPSNHPYFLIRYLDDPEGKWLKDKPENVKIASELFYIRINQIEKNPIRYWIKKYFPQTDSFMIWPEEGESIERTEQKIEMNLHGHSGPNGSRGSKRGIRIAYHSANQAHKHSPEIDGGIWSSGVMGYDHGYNVKTASSWLTASIVTYENGQRQMQIIPRNSVKWRI